MKILVKMFAVCIQRRLQLQLINHYLLLRTQNLSQHIWMCCMWSRCLFYYLRNLLHRFQTEKPIFPDQKNLWNTIIVCLLSKYFTRSWQDRWITFRCTVCFWADCFEGNQGWLPELYAEGMHIASRNIWVSWCGSFCTVSVLVPLQTRYWVKSTYIR